ncbi:ABC-type Zn uptake system ZnuABC Zn-binding protein ZnuA [Vibrio crassostreae]|uniref:ABC transporter substrate-binding protein n=1 Tax=Vibrio crassostreae TaxID=246167 RepID=UPI000F4EB2AE|nr:ABC transporter substrate-binding protein [Vibrio crassostreae]RPF04590.1 ABC-type Zn uptake system ZnuABC Zn-binding protein ZnuA [Vibrio crassostreae]TCW09154.1 ABC-type Zn uptake system ZnuABC Zn-binding protein ZnuA [Vibrio crassostreae]CAK3169129.1 ABC-type Zn uptake system ZnuABC Zn-binding protein ZnuA [Vibrio crassostreae]CAK3289513.1 ABC-type Zn uptake system ZnuABC Zn-binding protein ZnuA [Vibrio crassostreae]CAK3703727.1 ABC-type Zn uptake system ZnuABC Zn-binding protein ZnuA [V
MTSLMNRISSSLKATAQVSAVSSLLLAGSMVSISANAEDILTSTPVTYALATELTKGTDITTEYLPPKRYGIDRLPNWFGTKGANKVLQSGEKATVAVTLSSIWQADPTFVYARQGNIRLVEVDAAQAITPRAQGVAALTLSNGDVSKYAWLNPTNLTRMAAIVADDFKLLWPAQAETIDSNLQRVMLDVRELINKQQAVLLDNDVDSVLLLSESLEDFVSGSQLFVEERMFKAELEWTDEDKAKLKEMFSEDDALWLVTAKKPTNLIKSLVPNERILVVDSVDRWGRAGINKKSPFTRWEVQPFKG